MDFDTTVKLHIYWTITETTKAPTVIESAAALEKPVEEVERAYFNLSQQRLLVLEPGVPSKIRMAPPFANIATPFKVNVNGKSYFANCVWDAFGVATALDGDAKILSSCGYSAEPMLLEVRNGRPLPIACAIHFAVPAAKWWEDIIYT